MQRSFLLLVLVNIVHAGFWDYIWGTTAPAETPAIDDDWDEPVFVGETAHTELVTSPATNLHLRGTPEKTRAERNRNKKNQKRKAAKRKQENAQTGESDESKDFIEVDLPIQL